MPDRTHHPCIDQGLSQDHIRVFHAIATGLRDGHDPAIVQDLLAHGLLRSETDGYIVPEPVATQLADWIAWTAAQMARDVDGTSIYDSRSQEESRH
jgi:hypothetical protein